MSSAYHINGPNFYGFDPDDGSPLAAGKLYSYEPGTTTLRSTYTTEAADVANTNPVILNSAGYASVHLAGVYRLALYDANDVLVWDESPVSQGNLVDVYDSDTYAADTGVADAYVVTLASWAIYQEGAGLSFKAANDSTGASTINVSGLGVTAIKKDYNLPIEAGDIKAGGIYHLRYDGVNFQMVEPSSPVTSAEINRLDGISLTDPIITLPGGNVTPMLFYLDVAPTGWTIAAAVDEHSVRLTKGSVAGGQAGGETGGTNNFSAQFTTINAGATALSVAQMPGHTHTMDAHSHTLLGNSGTGDQVFQSNFPFASSTSGGSYMTNTGTGTTNTAGVQATTATMQTAGSGATHTHTVDLQAKWAACIIATKD